MKVAKVSNRLQLGSKILLGLRLEFQSEKFQYRRYYMKMSDCGERENPNSWKEKGIESEGKDWDHPNVKHKKPKRNIKELLFFLQKKIDR